MPRCLLLAFWWLLPLTPVALAGAPASPGNRLVYLDEGGPYYPHRKFPKLTTPQWVGEDGVEAVVILSIDDMRDPARYEKFLRPILNRLKKIDGRAPVSIMTCKVEPKDPQLQTWLKEGLSLEIHTIDHPCPFFKIGFEKASATYHNCVDLINEIPGNKPVAFRMPCCDSLNTPSPRFFAEVFNKVSPQGRFLSIDSSVFNVFTANDPELPRDLVLRPDGTERFRRYLPMDRDFCNWIEDYPYPYIIDRLCWQFPCVTPSDWEANHLQKPNNPLTVKDWQAALDATVIKQGVFPLVFHPHGWIKAEQIVELIDYTVAKHGKKVKFLTFRECEERLTKNLLAGQSLRQPRTGGDNGIRLVDLDNDGYLDVRIASQDMKKTRIWDRKSRAWRDGPFQPLPQWQPPAPLPPGMARRDVSGRDTGLRFVDLDGDGQLDIYLANEKQQGIYLFQDLKTGWKKIDTGKIGLPLAAKNGKNNGLWFHSRHVWVGNEDTAPLKNHIEKRSFNELLANVDPKPLSPEAGLRSMKPRPGFTIELLAAEPLVQDPIAFAWGLDGKLWVVEMGDYPLGVDGKGKFGGRVKFLQDTDGDGKYDKATVFLDGLGYPTGVLPWKKGVLVTCAPDIFYAEDTDGDGKADKKEILYTGFTPGNQQHRVNSLVWGLDNWIHVANGDSGGTVKSVKTGQSVNIGGRDLRIRPDTGEIETQTGQTQFGRGRDDWGNWFGNNNTNPLYHFVLDDGYMSRNPFLAGPSPKQNVSVAPGAAPVFPTSRTLTRFNSPGQENRFTSACSSIIYRDELFGPTFSGNSFVSEPVHNLIHREIVEPRGCTFTSRRAPDEQESEFLTSTDNWFRPTMIQTGPDGALWVADMYRHVIEHPQWIPQDWQKKLDLRAGHDKGRIYRVYPVGVRPRAFPRLDKLDTAGLVAALDSPSGWQRDTSQMLLVQQQDRAATPLLEQLLRESKHPRARLHALCTLAGFGKVPPTVLALALHDEHPGVRRQAIRLSEPLLAENPALGAALLKLVADGDAPVRLQLAWSLGTWNDPRSGEALARLALKEEDAYLRAGVLSSVNKGNIEPLFRTLLTEGKGLPTGPLLDGLLRLAERFGRQQILGELLGRLAGEAGPGQAATAMNAAANLLDALEQRGRSLRQLWAEGPSTQKALQPLTSLFNTARQIAPRPQAALEHRLAAVRLLGRGLDQQQQDVALLADLLTPQTPPELAGAALQSLGRLSLKETPGMLLRGWKSYTPNQRGVVLDALLARPAATTALLDAVEHKKVLPLDLDAARRQRLLEHKDAAIRKRACSLLADTLAPDRQKVIAAFRPALTLTGHPERGGAVFRKVCSACHQLGGVGNNLGPDLAMLAGKTNEYLLENILDPNRAVEPRYLGYTATTKAGVTLSGLLLTETGTTITLADASGKQHQLLRADLDDLYSSGKSSMPEGLEKDLSPQDFADLLAHLRKAQPAVAPKSFAGNHPEVVQPDEKGVLQLTAKNCAIHGPKVVFESKYANLGFWGHVDDRAIWTAVVPQAGKYEVWLNWACAKETAGNRLVLEAGASRLEGTVQPTASWDHYQSAFLGTVELPAGRQELALRALPPLRGYLLDLKGLRLVPRGR